MFVRNFFVACLVNLAIVTVSLATPSYPQMTLSSGYRQVFPGGDTVCARGEEFSFFYRPGDEDKIVIDFVGGGACWSYETCHRGSGVFVDSVDASMRWIAEEDQTGIYDQNNQDNPVKDWTHVVIPYCTGDIHWGDSVHVYGEGENSYTIFHKGAVNAKRVLEWAFNNYDPSQIFVMGTSAGGYASLYWLPYIKEHAQDASVVQMADGAAGVATTEFFNSSFFNWNAMNHAPRWISSIDPDLVDWHNLNFTDFYTEVGRYYPNVTLSQFNTNFDKIQIFFYRLMGGRDKHEWVEKALYSLNSISQSLDNFYYFHSGGEVHTILPDDELYSLSTNGVRLLDWMHGMIDTSDAADVVCTQCETEEMIGSLR